jgi:hypothetical protein
MATCDKMEGLIEGGASTINPSKGLVRRYPGGGRGGGGGGVYRASISGNLSGWGGSQKFSKSKVSCFTQIYDQDTGTGRRD